MPIYDPMPDGFVVDRYEVALIPGDRVILRSARNPVSGVVLAVHGDYAWVDVFRGAPWSCSLESLERQP